MATKLRLKGNQIIKQLVQNKQFNTVINLGCGNDTDKEGGYYSDYFNAKKIIKIDPNTSIKGLDYHAKSEDLPLKNKMADLVFLNWVFIPNDPSVDIEIEIGPLSYDGKQIGLSVSCFNESTFIINE